MRAGRAVLEIAVGHEAPIAAVAYDPRARAEAEGRRGALDGDQPESLTDERGGLPFGPGVQGHAVSRG